MLWIFYINNGGEHYAELTYDWDTDTYKCQLLANFKDHIIEAPLLMEILFQQGLTVGDDKFCRMFIRDRVVPSGRQNIGVFLRKLGVPYYHECFMLRGMPLSVMDDARVDFVKEIT